MGALTVARLRMAGRLLFLTALALVILLFVAAWALTRTRAGQDLVLREAVARVRTAIDGELTVGGVRSRQILFGGRFLDVVIADAQGRPFLVADSVDVAYSVPGLLAGDIRFSRLGLYRPRVILERLPGQDRFNVARIFVGDDEPSEPPDSPPDSAAPAPLAPPPPEGGRRVVFRRVDFYDGRVDVVLPAGPGPEPERGQFETLPGVEGRVRRFSFTNIQGRLDEMRLADPAFPGPLFVVDSLALTALVLDEPFDVRRFSGTVAWEEEGILVEARSLDLPGTRATATGTIRLGEQGPDAAFEIDAPVLSLADVRWAVPALPADAAGNARLTLTLRPGVIGVTWREAALRWGESRLSGGGSVVAGDATVLDGVDLVLDPLRMAELRAYVPDTLPLTGSLRGRVRLAGPMTGPWVSAQVTLDQSARARGPTVVDASGIVYLDGSPGFSDFEARLDPAQLDLITDFVPRLGLRGLGSLRLQASGRLADGVRFRADVEHRPVDLPHSRVSADGTLRRGEDELALDVDATLDPLSFTAWRAYAPDFPLSGDVRGTVRVEGPVSRLSIASELETVAGSLALDARIDGRDPLASYELAGALRDFRVSELLPGLPDPSTVTGAFQATGSGGTLADARGSAEVALWSSHLGVLDVDTAAAQLRVEDGFLRVDTLTARTSVMDLGAVGTLALADSLGTGRIDAEFRAASLEGIRPYLMGDSLIARDTLSTLELEGLRLEGVDPDTLPLAEEIAVDGTAEGRFTVTGSARRFALEGTASLQGLRYADNRVASATLDFGATGLPASDRTISATIDGTALEILGRSFQGGRLEAERTPEGGRVAVELTRTESEVYNGRATFQRDSVRTAVNLDELTFRFGDRRWNLGGPASVVWSDSALDVRDLRVRTPDGTGLDVAVDGRIAQGEVSDLRVEALHVPLDRMAHLLQLDPSRRYDGLLDAHLVVAGTVEAPVITGSVGGVDVRYESIRLDRVDGSLDYADRAVRTRWTATRGDRVLLRAEGTVPVDLAWSARDRIPDEPIDLDIQVDSFPAALAMGLLESFEEVEGTFTGAFQVGGTLNSPAPTGSVRLAGGAALVPALGVRHRDVEADLRLTPDGTVQVDGRLSSVGPMTVSGTVVLDTLSNPYLDLETSASGFLAADRADVLATVGGNVRVEGRYRRPLVEGQIQVETGAVYLSEIQRTAEVVDLSEPLFLDVVDTTLVASQPLFAAGENPFLRNLRLDVEMSLDRDFWLRSREMNVEIEGDLQVFWDRTSRDLAMVGELQAVRGTYSRFGRQFQVQQGTVRFIGTPGLNPDLNILAVNRLRVRDGEPLNIFALLEGTLLSPRVTLSSDAQPPIASSELVSYLIFGRPTYELASAEFGLVQGEFGGLFGSAAGAGASLAFGALGTQIGTAVAQEIGVDYFAISQAQGSAAFGTGFESALRATQVEVGWYVAQDVFLALLLRPLLGINSSGISGARLEWRATDLWTVEGYLEDRFARELNTGFSVNEAFQVPKVWGLFLAREWGY